MSSGKMTTCKSCGAEIAKGGKVTCPKCGKVNKKPVYTRVWFIILCLIVVFAVAGSLGGGDEDTNSQSANTATESNEVATEEPEVKPTPLVVTTDEIIDALKSNALNASNTYKDQYVELTGKLVNIDSSGDYFSIGPLNDEYSFDSVMCMISEEHLNAVSGFSTGQEVTVIGTITDVGEVMGYTLEVETIK
jgi:predicted nucleic acid-binding Zn ribbon protein